MLVLACPHHSFLVSSILTMTQPSAANVPCKSYTLVQEIVEGDLPSWTLVPDALLDPVVELLKDYGGCPPYDWPRKLKDVLGPILDMDRKSTATSETVERGQLFLGSEGFGEIPNGCVISRFFCVIHE